jgi:circadian clock protein KaiB
MIKDDGSSPDWDEENNSIYQLRLFVAGASPGSVRAINNLNIILEQHLKNRYEMEIIDVHQQQQLVQANNVTAVPMLIKLSPLPLRRLVGDMSDTEKVLRGLNLA